MINGCFVCRAYPPYDRREPLPIRDPLAAKYEAMARREGSPSVRKEGEQGLPPREGDTAKPPSEHSREGSIEKSRVEPIKASRPLVDVSYGTDSSVPRMAPDVDIPPPPPYHDPAYRDWYGTYKTT